MNQNNSTESELKKEEIRGLFVLGLLAVLASIRVQSEKMMVTVGQLTFDMMPLLNITIILWSFYAMFMVFGLSEDMLGKSASNMFRETAKAFLYFNFLALGFLSLMLGLLAFPSRLPWALGLMSLLVLYAVFEKLREITKLRKSDKPLKLGFKNWVKSNLRPLSTVLILFCFVMIMFGSDERHVIPFFVIGCVGIAIFIITIRREKGKVSTQIEA